MDLKRLYYLLKPTLPLPVRLALRRLRGAHRRKAFAATWPIDPAAGATPPDWPGWPHGRQFAVVLTHDVEGIRGLNRVQSLLDLEAELGFRSAFFFVPEGEYRVADVLRHTIERAGFEVGIHGLKHDGKLYSSRKLFEQRATRIKHYMHQWQVAGFRSPFMHNQLGWQHLLGAAYDSSTFDTDPFEPQPEGVRTMFPFWVPGPQGSDFVELPYTLVQDFTLFVILRETNIDIWKQKVDWIAAHGGMALLNAHPDYMSFAGKAMRTEYPVSHYKELLNYVRERYEGQYWHALPKEVREYYCATVPHPTRDTPPEMSLNSDQVAV